MTIQEHISLKNYTTFKTGGTARFFVAVTAVKELEEAVRFAEEKKLSIFILGGGSNILISDTEFAGIVIKIEIKGKVFTNKDKQTVEAVIGAGESWDEFVNYCVEQKLYGIENLSFIPGTVGATPVQNIGAYGVEIMDSILWVEVFNTETKKIEKLSHDECQFSYRDSLFKKPQGKKFIITRVAYLLSREKKLHTEYKDIKEYIVTNNLEEQELTSSDIREIVIAIRKRKLPNVFVPDALGTAGSFFKNPIITELEYKKLLEKYPGLVAFPFSDNNVEKIKISAAWMLDKLCNFRGYREGKVGVFNNQALVLINFGGATSREVLELSEKMKQCVKEKTGIELEREVELVQ